MQQWLENPPRPSDPGRDADEGDFRHATKSPVRRRRRALAQVWPVDLATAATIIERTLPASNQPGSRARQYTIAIPDNLETGVPAPVIMVLHGCLQTDQDMVDDTGFVELVDREGLIAVFPFVTSFASSEQRRQNCWGFWFDQHQHEGRGEPGDLRRILAEVEGEFPLILTAAMWSACHQAPPWL